jgi:hypothetical protein
MTGLGRCTVCGSDAGVYDDFSKRFTCVRHLNVTAQGGTVSQHWNVYCLICLDRHFHLPAVKVKKLTNAGLGACPRCEGPGPLVWI